MKRDQLEKFIQTNRDAFDTAVPPMDVWKNIDAALPGRSARVIQFRKVMRVAASVLLLLFAGAVIGNYYAGIKQQDATALIEEVAPGFSEAAQYYQTQINQKYTQVVNYQNADAIDADLAEIDKAMEELKQELINAPKGSEAKIIEELINSYKIKLGILESMLEYAQPEDDNLKNGEHEVRI